MVNEYTALEFENLTLGYNRHPAIHHLNAKIARGEMLAVVGPNGAGKSTLLKAICGQLVPLDGTIHYPVCAHSGIAYLPQRQTVDPDFPISVREVVAAGLWRETGAFSRFNTQQITRIETALEQVGLNEFASQPFGNLSGGQVQRALFARTLVQDAPIIVLDEPFNALDSSSSKMLTDALLQLNASGTTIIAVLHNMRVVKEIFPRAMLLARELVVHASTGEVFTPENLLRAQHMQESFDELAQVCQLENGTAA